MIRADFFKLTLGALLAPLLPRKRDVGTWVRLSQDKPPNQGDLALLIYDKTGWRRINLP